MKREGSIVIELMASILIISSASLYIISCIIDCNKTIERRRVRDLAEANINNLAEEIKYNVSRKEFLKKIDAGYIGLKYEENFAREVVNKNFNELERGNDLIINLISQDEEKIVFEIKLSIKKDDDEIFIKKDFHKSWWMDEIQKG